MCHVYSSWTAHVLYATVFANANASGPGSDSVHPCRAPAGGRARYRCPWSRQGRRTSTPGPSLNGILAPSSVGASHKERLHLVVVRMQREAGDLASGNCIVSPIIHGQREPTVRTKRHEAKSRTLDGLLGSSCREDTYMQIQMHIRLPRSECVGVGQRVGPHVHMLGRKKHMLWPFSDRRNVAWTT